MHRLFNKNIFHLQAVAVFNCPSVKTPFIELLIIAAWYIIQDVGQLQGTRETAGPSYMGTRSPGTTPWTLWTPGICLLKPSQMQYQFMKLILN